MAPPTPQQSEEFAKDNYGLRLPPHLCEASAFHTKQAWEARREKRKQEWEAHFGEGTAFSQELMDENPQFKFSDAA